MPCCQNYIQSVDRRKQLLYIDISGWVEAFFYCFGQSFKMKKITESEWHILESLWGQSPLSAREIFEAIPEPVGIGLKTVRTLLERLLKKDLVNRSQVHGVYVFEPNVEREACVRERGRRFLDLFFRGKPETLFAHFLQSEPIDPATAKRLHDMLEKKIEQAENGSEPDNS